MFFVSEQRGFLKKTKGRRKERDRNSKLPLLNKDLIEAKDIMSKEFSRNVNRNDFLS